MSLILIAELKTYLVVKIACIYLKKKKRLNKMYKFFLFLPIDSNIFKVFKIAFLMMFYLSFLLGYQDLIPGSYNY